ncbi:17-beta-hydroxysteroid dehydrogenase 14-like isoform X1 [Xenia sp. Carnegie-2017]|uniref:17-beta-hydroxysteroid dehydrogenase 14-like isoform X1 n=1 Tax=Xenia sp. Carnegie-2017 TaxID=2897299 RepID=UPI001F038946|nr:17-beta-hydroxysteroid dehydrogenase 14-like isoform X1 [Xenia sp. Carnegie-2017]
MATERLRYKNKVVIVTGGSKGIGEGIVREFVNEGSKVVFCARKEADGKVLETEINKVGPGESFFVKCDVQKEENLKNLVHRTVEKYGKIDCVINNAGWHPSYKTIDDTSAEDFASLFNLNVVSYFLLCKMTLPYLRQSKGNIINISSLVSMIGQEGAVAYCATKVMIGLEDAVAYCATKLMFGLEDAVAYCATKGAIASMTRALAVDEAKHEVRVNCVSPGNVWTPLWEKLASEQSDKEAAITAGEKAQLLGRMGTLEEMGKCCVYLASEGTFCTGIDLPLSGGAELNYGEKSK